MAGFHGRGALRQLDRALDGADLRIVKEHNDILHRCRNCPILQGVFRGRWTIRSWCGY